MSGESEMVSRVAEALCGSPLQDSGAMREFYEQQARVAIEAMREPTHEMLNMGHHFYDKAECGLLDTNVSPLFNAWDAMIDAALSPSS